ncbi:phosphatidylglycerophosphatase A [Arenicella chitinivorans]|uniref:Phosphatidylglycerophosphatase A n=1 Tax=Arenicella chitinivorans TaxID=1329800 RepID=A0A918VPQ5_9GAMM|nr:phosphatidylglycerophosphatase A [Arenicella chitinivorans]GHA15146.1 phosphatidylglycerophosphatase A [Arenicella chitinivorans]
MTDAVQFQLRNPIHLFALGFGSGLIKPAPGTWGTLASVPVFWVIVQFLPPAQLGYAMMLAVTFLFGVYVCGQTARDVGVHDHGSIVWDEFVGYFVTMAMVPPSWLNLALGFVLFRVLDIVKPWPIKLLDKHVHGGLGIMIDDVVAGVIAATVLYFAQPYLP